MLFITIFQIKPEEIAMEKLFDQEWKNYTKNVRRWFDAIKSRPAVRRGIDVGKEARNFGEGISKESLKTMFKQDAKSIAEMAKKKESE